MTKWSSRFERLRVVGSLLLVTASAAACVRSDQVTTIFPDGSGKISLSIAFKKEAHASPIDPDTLMKQVSGIAAWKIDPPVDQGDWVRYSYVAYFEDINAVTFLRQRGPGAGVTSLDFAFEPAGAGGTLMVFETTSETGSTGQEPPLGETRGLREAEAALQLMKPLFHDLRVSFALNVPGPVVDAPDFLEKNGRSALFVLDGPRLFGAEGDPIRLPPGFQALMGETHIRIVWTETTVPASETLAFKQELLEAQRTRASAPDEK